MSRAACLTVLLLILAPTAPARAEGDVFVGGSATGEYLHNTELDASAFDTRVEVDAVVGDFLFGTVFRAYQLSDPNYNPADIDVPPTEIKHRFAEYAGEGVTLRAGHFFSTFGRGLSFRSYEEVDLEHDTSLDGLIAETSIGVIELTALGGTTTERLSATGYREHTIRAARAAAPLTEWLDVAASAVERASERKDEDVEYPAELARFDDVVLGTEVQAWAGPLTLTAEYAGRNGENPVTGEDEVRGHATYVSGTLGLPWVTLFGEFKDYESYEHYLVNPPTCVRDHAWTLMNRATYEPHLGDERGFLAEATVPLGESVSLTGGASEARDHDGDLLHWEMFGEAERSSFGRFGGSVAGSMSRTYELGQFTERVSGAIELEAELAHGVTAQVQLEGQTTEDRVTDNDHDDYMISLTVYPGFDSTVSAVYERSNDESEERESWFLVEFKKQLSDDLEIALSAGTERGGKKCTGGVCYFEPEFEGARLRLTTFF